MAEIREGSLVLYKNRPARVAAASERLEIELEAGKTLKVRPKDVVLLHPGPLRHLGELQPQAGEVETAWELLQGSPTCLEELAELVYGAYTPATAWAAWQLVAEGLYFRGTPEAIRVRSPEEVAQERAARAARAAEEAAWSAFLAHVREGCLGPEDERYLREVEEVALGRRTFSPVLRALGWSETPEQAHALLLKLGHWDALVDPYPQRLGVARQAPQVALPPLAEEPRVDLTHLPAFAIDDEGNRDPDDALSLEGKRLWVHVADVAALVPPDSPADVEARARGVSLYLPEGTVPMLPPAAAQRLGLGLQEVSPALSFGIELDAEGRLARVEVVRSWVRVTRLSYAEAEAQLHSEPLCSLHRLTQRYRARRQARGATDIALPEVRIRVREGQVWLEPLPPLASRSLVQEAMLMAGEAAARFALAHDLPLPFTTQDPPEAAGEPLEGLAGMYALRRTMKRSQPSTTPGPHAGLGLEVYTRATSPLRRYLDLVVHQQLRAYLRGEAPLSAAQVLERVGAAEAVTGTARQAERLARRHWTLVYLLQQPRWRGEGVVVEKRGLRATVLIPALALEAQVLLPQEVPLNSPVSLVLSSVDLPALDVRFRVEG
ncbi:MAG: exoribonuclease II [Candidatus Tectimicrobiota bacterium]|nr:MAG: exoribonuclease II [Candidatus Tectomicrobia bacterium]